MKSQESTQKFQQADALFKQGRYSDALQLLQQLNAAFPKSKNILYPAALCFEKLGNKEQALALCGQLANQFQDPRAQALQARLQGAPQPQSVPGDTLDMNLNMDDMSGLNLGDLDGPGVDMGGMGEILDYKPTVPKPIVQSGGMPDWVPKAAIGAGVVVVVLIVLLPLLMGGGSGGNSTPGATNDGGTSASWGVLYRLLIPGAVGYITFCLTVYVVLSMMTKVLHDTLIPNLLDVALISLIFMLLNLIPVIGFILGWVLIAKHYEMTCGELFVFGCLQGLLGIGAYFFISMPLITALGK